MYTVINVIGVIYVCHKHTTAFMVVHCVSTINSNVDRNTHGHDGGSIINPILCILNRCNIWNTAAARLIRTRGCRPVWSSQQTPNVGLMLGHADAGPTLNQHWINVYRSDAPLQSRWHWIPHDLIIVSTVGQTWGSSGNRYDLTSPCIN